MQCAYIFFHLQFVSCSLSSWARIGRAPGTVNHHLGTEDELEGIAMSVGTGTGGGQQGHEVEMEGGKMAQWGRS